MSDDSVRYRKMRALLKRFAVEVGDLAREAEKLANDPERPERIRDQATGVAAAYSAARHDVSLILQAFPDNDDG